MSSFAYGALTRKRDEAPADQSVTQSTGLGAYVDALAALVPVEVLAAHAIILSFTTSKTSATDSSGNATTATAVTEPAALKVTFFALIVLSALLYLGGRQPKKVTPGVVVGALTPPAAFVAWTMIQRTTAFDALAPGMDFALREVIGVLLAVILPVGAGLYASKLNSAPPSTATVAGGGATTTTSAAPTSTGAADKSASDAAMSTKEHGTSPSPSSPAATPTQTPEPEPVALEDAQTTTVGQGPNEPDDPDATRLHRLAD